MRGFLFGLVVVCSSLFLMSEQSQAQSYSSFVVVPNIESKIIRGEFRFCPKENLRGLICGDYADFFGKRTFMVRDWWTPETYAQAYTQNSEVQVVSLEPTANGQGVIIRFR